jgi:hypothetical protein
MAVEVFHHGKAQRALRHCLIQLRPRMGFLRSSNKASSGWIVPHIGIQRGESARSTFVHGLRQYHVDLVALWVAAHHAGDFDTGLHHWFASGVVDELSAFFSCFHSRLVDWKRMNK